MWSEGRSVAAWLALAGVMVSASCSERTDPTAVYQGAPAAAQGGNGKVHITKMQLSSNTLNIEGPSVDGFMHFGNNGSAVFDVGIRAEIVQGAATREATSRTPVNCDPSEPGKLPNGGCDMDFTAAASNLTDGTGTLIPGSAVFVMHIVQGSGATETELANKSINVSLVAAPIITSLTLASTTLAIDGPATTYAATVVNPAATLHGVILQGYIVQGVARQPAGGLQVSCGGGIGVLPPGTCAVSFTASASNFGSSGPLVPGAAEFELDLISSDGGTQTTYDVKTVAVTLVSSAPKITSLDLASHELVIEGPRVDYTVQMQNPGFPLTGMVLQGWIRQGAASRAAGGSVTDCGAGLGVLPTTGTGTCTMHLTVGATNTGLGSGTLVPGVARFVLQLNHSDGSTTTLDSVVVEVDLLPQMPTITDLTPSSGFVVLEGTGTSYSTTIDNPGSSSVSTVIIQGYISQGAARRAAGGEQVSCGGATGELPPGSCTLSHVIVASNSNGGTGTLVPGDATFELDLVVDDGSTTTVVDSKTVPITLVANTPSIVSVDLSSSTAVINGSSVSYSLTLYNPTGADLSGVSFQTYLVQGATYHAAGGSVVACASNNTDGILPQGSCTVTYTMNPSESTSGTGTFVPGSADFAVDLYQGSNIVDSRTVTVTLVSQEP